MIYQRLAKVFLICSNPLNIQAAGNRDHGQDASDKDSTASARTRARPSQAGAAIFELDKEDRQILREPLLDLLSRLRFEMLEFIYAQHPELRPLAVPPTISSDLRWKDVTLPKSVSEADLDTIIFSI
jgi:hypothetical protein